MNALLTNWTDAEMRAVILPHLRRSPMSHWILVSHLPQAAYWRIREDWYWGGHPESEFVIAVEEALPNMRLYWCVADRRSMSEAMLRGSLERSILAPVGELGQPIILIGQAGDRTTEPPFCRDVDDGTIIAAGMIGALAYQCGLGNRMIGPAVVVPLLPDSPLVPPCPELGDDGLYRRESGIEPIDTRSLGWIV